MLNDLGIRQLINGPIPITPDGEPILGKAPELDNVFVAGGFTSGIAGAGGAGRQLAQWIVEGASEFDLWSFDVQRFGPHHVGAKYLHERAVEAYHRYYLIHWPGEEEHRPRVAAARSSMACSTRPAPCSLLRLGTAQLVRQRHPTAPRGTELVRRRRPRMPRDSRACGADRPELVLQVRGRRPRRRRLPAAPRRRQCRQEGRRADLHPGLQRKGWHRGRPHLHACRRGPLLRRHRQCLRHPRRLVDPSPHAGRRLGHADRRHQRLGGDQLLRPQEPRPARARRRFRRLERRPALHGDARDPPGLRPLPRRARHLCRRTGLRAAHPGRIRRARLRPAVAGGPGPRRRQRRLPRDRVLPPGKALPLLGQRHRPRLHAVGGRPRLRGGDEEGDFIGRARSSSAAPKAPSASSASSCSTATNRSTAAKRSCATASRQSPRAPVMATRSAVDRLRLPADRGGRARRLRDRGLYAPRAATSTAPPTIPNARRSSHSSHIRHPERSEGSGSIAANSKRGG